jgi:hypothetical protein
LKRAVREQRDLFAPTVILIEDKASGAQLIQDLLADGLSQVTRYAPDGAEIMRLQRRPRRSKTASSTSPKPPIGCPITSPNSCCPRTPATTTRSIPPRRR